MKKYILVALVATSIVIVGCSSNDDDSDAMSETNTSETDTGGDGDTSDNMSEGTTDNSSEPDTTEAESVPVDFGNSVMGILAVQPDLNLIEAAVHAADLAQTLHDPSNTWTVFAPNDTAMEGKVADLDLLLGQIHAGFQNEDGLMGLVGSTIGMTGGARHEITLAEDGVTLQIGGTNVVQAGITGDNGVVFKMDGVLQ